MIHVLVNMDDLTRIERDFGMRRDKTNLVLRAAINNTAKDVKHKMAKGAGQRYALNTRGMEPYKSITKITKATTKTLEAFVIAKDGPQDLYEYKLNDRTYYPGSKGAPRWIKAKQMRSGSLKNLAVIQGAAGDKHKAFVVKYHSGHLAIAERIPGTHMKGSPEKEAIRSLYATSKPKAEEIIYDREVAVGVQDLLQRNIQIQTQRFLK